MKLLLTWLFISASTLLFAQNTINGIVKDGQTGLPLSGATVYIDEFQPVYLTQKNGSFQIQIENEKSVQLTISYLGYSTKFINVSRFGGVPTYQHMN